MAKHTVSLGPHGQFRKHSLNFDRSRSKRNAMQAQASVSSQRRVTACAPRLSPSQGTKPPKKLMESRLNQRRQNEVKPYTISEFQAGRALHSIRISRSAVWQRRRKMIDFGQVWFRGSRRTNGPEVISDQAYWKKVYLRGDHGLTAGIQMRQ